MFLAFDGSGVRQCLWIAGSVPFGYERRSTGKLEAPSWAPTEIVDHLHDAAEPLAVYLILTWCLAVIVNKSLAERRREATVAIYGATQAGAVVTPANNRGQDGGST
jgi:hypothetical protein